MKKGLIRMVALTIVISLAACGMGAEDAKNEEFQDDLSNATETTNAEDSLVEDEDFEITNDEEINDLLEIDLKDRSSMSEEDWVAAYEAKEELMDFEMDEVAYAWHEIENNHSVTYSYYALVTNTGKVPIDIFPHSVNFYNKDGSIAAISNGGLSVSPHTLNAGEKSLIRMYAFNHDADVNDFDHPELNVDIFLSHYDSTKLDIENATYQIDRSLKASASIVNDTDIDAVAISSAFVFYNDNGDFIGGLMSGIVDKLQAGSNTEIEADYPPFPKEQYEYITSMEAWSYFVDYGDDWMN